jgi:hypothetical protein
MRPFMLDEAPFSDCLRRLVAHLKKFQSRLYVLTSWARVMVCSHCLVLYGN